MSSQDAQENAEQPSPPPQGRLGAILAKIRAPAAQVRAHPRIALAIAAALFLAVGSLAAWRILRPSPLQVARRAAETALEALDEDDLEGAKKLAQDLSKQTDLAEPTAVAEFILGIVSANEAEKAAPPARGPLFLAAARYAQDALNGGLPDDRREEAQWLLGRSLYEAGQTAASRAVLTEALEAQPQHAARIRRLMAESYLRDDPPKLAQALEQNKLYLAIEDLTPSQRRQGLLQLAEILVTMGKPEQCRDVLAKLGADAKYLDAASVLEGRALLEEARALKAKAASSASQRQAAKKLQAALAALRGTGEIDPAHTPSGRQALYLIGLCLLESGDVQGALDQFSRLRTLDPAAPEYVAAAFQRGGLLWGMGRRVEAASAYCRALEAIRSARDFRNPWISLESLHKKAWEAYQYCEESRNYSAALELARRAAAVVPEDEAAQMQAETCRAWGRDLVAQAENAEPAKAAILAREGRAHLRRASRLWQQLADRRKATRFYPEDLWESATCALEGRDYRATVALLEQYMREDPRGRRPKALAALGESLLCLDRVDEAIAAFRKCIERYPHDVALLRARLLAGQALWEKRDVGGARRVIEQNLNGESLTPASREYRQSLLALARILHEAKRFDEAIPRLEETITRYADSREALEARYLIADCYRQKALAEREKLKRDRVEQSRAARLQNIGDVLTTSLDWYRQAQQALLKRQEIAQLTPLESLMLRNTYYFIGSVLLDLGQYNASIQAYTRAASRYPSDPETLESHLQMARAFRAMNKTREARGAIEQAKHLLDRMKPDTLLQQTTNYSKPQWAALLNKTSAM